MIENLESKVVGFIGVVETVLELLFIDATYHSHGYGQSLLHFAVDKLKIKTVEVNEQNHKAVKFYLQAGFSIVNRRPIDNDDKEHPILELSL
ncbi:MAG: GNAT family N-acetyltransferase [Flavobacteriaceae bacterium]|nr:GNAT family N-acetyltransferase [Flavobacteriaceae bacterium]